LVKIERLKYFSNIDYYYKLTQRGVIKIVELTEIEISVLRAMHSRQIYGKHHKKIETVMHSGFPSHLRKEVKKAILSLIKKGYILWYHKDDKSLHLNKKLYYEIDRIVRK